VRGLVGAVPDAVHGWKGGIGTSSRRLPDVLGAYGRVLVRQLRRHSHRQRRSGGRELGRYYLREETVRERPRWLVRHRRATDAPGRRHSSACERALLGWPRSDRDGHGSVTM